MPNGCKRVSIQHLFGFNWHPLEGAGTLYVVYIYLYIHIYMCLSIPGRFRKGVCLRWPNQDWYFSRQLLAILCYSNFKDRQRDFTNLRDSPPTSHQLVFFSWPSCSWFWHHAFFSWCLHFPVFSGYMCFFVGGAHPHMILVFKQPKNASFPHPATGGSLMLSIT